MMTTTTTTREEEDGDEDDDDDDGSENESADGIYLGKKPPGSAQTVEEDEEKDPYAISDDSDDDAQMEEIRRKILAAKPFSNAEDASHKKVPETIPRPQRLQHDSDAEPDSDNGEDGEDDDFDSIIDATPRDRQDRLEQAREGEVHGYCNNANIFVDHSFCAEEVVNHTEDTGVLAKLLV